MIFIPLLHYFQCKNTYSGNEEGMRYRLTPGKCKVTGEDGAEQERSTLTVDVWPDPWTLEFTDPALRRAGRICTERRGPGTGRRLSVPAV